MALPTPTLDDRTFQDLVDDAKRLLQQRVPAWTDHNVHDPGVTLIELFAWMTEQLIYRLNRVPDRLYLRFLDLIGVRLLPPSAARTAQTFWLSAPQDDVVSVPVGTEVATKRTGSEEPLVFTTTDDLAIVPSTFAGARSELTDGTTSSHASAITKGQRFPAFAKVPAPGDALLIALSAATPCNVVTLRFACTVEGVGVDPLDPPLVWEAWTGTDWTACELEKDDTGGLNRDGDVVVHVPAGHTPSVISGQRGAWLRARVLSPQPEQPQYSATPTITSVAAFTIGGTVEAVNARPVVGEVIGTSSGVPGESYAIAHAPVVQDDRPPVLEVALADDNANGTGWQSWVRVDDFAASGPEDPHFVLDDVMGQISLGPAVREADGRLVQHGKVPPAGAVLRLSYRSGGGSAGNIAARTLTVVRSAIPLISTTENRKSARGGRDAEDVTNARARGPMLLRSRGRAVTAEDYEYMALEVARDVARVRAIADTAAPNGVRVLVVPVVTEGRDGRFDFGELVPRESTLRAIADALEPRRIVGTRVMIEPPTYQGVTVVARLQCVPLADPDAVQTAALAALYRFLHPLTGGATGEGWPFGRPVHVGEIYGVLQRVRGVDLVEDARLFPADPVTGERGQAAQRIDIAPHALVFSYEHQARVTRSAS